jgi:hypothetical protein
MTWWGSSLTKDSFQPKQKSRFVVQMGNGGNLVSVKSTSKPSVTIESKQYRMINHYYNYPGLVKWEPISITFVDTKMWGDSVTYGDTYISDLDRLVADDEQAASSYNASESGFGPPMNRMTSHALWEMLIASGYTPPSYGKNDILPERAKGISSPEKASMVDLSFGKTLNIHQLHPDGASDKGVIKSVETWEIHNPIITKISWGELDYGDDGLVEYTLDITYDWAIHHPENPNSKEIAESVTIGGSQFPLDAGLPF